MPDVRLPALDGPLLASAGVTVQMQFVSTAAIASFALAVGGTVTDVDDLTGATIVDATMSGDGLTATVDLPVPAVANSVPLRMVVDGAVVALDRLVPSTTGTRTPSSDPIPVALEAHTFQMSVLGVVSGHPDLAAHDALGLATQAELDAEATARGDADTALDGRVDALEAVDPLTAADIGTTVQAHSAVLDATTAAFTAADETKLDGVEDGATADQSAAEVPIADAGGHYTAGDVEGVLQEVPTLIANGTSTLLTDTAGFVRIDGFEAFPRQLCNGTISVVSNRCYMVWGVALETRTIGNFLIQTRNVAMAGATTCRLGLWGTDGTTAMMLARSANNTALFASTTTLYTVAFEAADGYPASFELQKGERYALGYYIVATTTPQFVGISASNTDQIWGADLLPPFISRIDGSMPASFNEAIASSDDFHPWMGAIA